MVYFVLRPYPWMNDIPNNSIEFPQLFFNFSILNQQVTIKRIT